MRTKSSTFRMNLCGLFVPTILTLLGVSCTQPKEQGAFPIPNEDTLREDSIQMERVFERRLNNESTLPLDLADDIQYGFVVHRVLASGNNPANSPHLFDLIEDAREAAVSRRQRGADDSTGIAQSALESASEPCAHLLPLGESTSGSSNNFAGSVLSSCKGGSQYTYQDLTVYRTDAAQTEFTVLGSTYSEEYGDGRFFQTDPVNASINNTQVKQFYMDSLLIADEINGVAGTPQFTYVSAKTQVVPVLQSLTLSHPTDLIAPSSGVNTVRTCLERGTATGNLDCDYASVKKNPDGTLTLYPTAPTGIAAVNETASLAASPPQWKADTTQYWAPVGGAAYDKSKLYLPLKGVFNAGATGSTVCTINSIDVASTSAKILLIEQGGRCTAGKGPGTPVAGADLSANVALSGTTASFNFLGNFGTDCLGYLQDVNLVITIKANTACGPRFKTLSFTATAHYTLDFKNSCFAEGTLVRLADGRSVAIESIGIGNQVVADDSGRLLTVTSMSHGSESRAMIRLLDEMGHEVMVTEKHPVVLGTGVIVTADTLSVGDLVQTEVGSAKLTAVERMPYEGRVYNLTLGTSDELSSLALSEKTMFANGFLMGDNEVQDEMSRPSKPSKEELVARLPTVWHRDYENDLARAATRP